MKKQMIMHFFLVLCFALPGQSTFIYYMDLSFDYPNANSFTTLSFSFSLDTTLVNTDYLKIQLPFLIHTGVNA